MDILQLAEPDATASTWLCSRVDCIGGAAAQLHRAASERSVVLGQDMLRMATNVQRILEGEFAALKAGQQRPWLIVRAVQDSEYAVITDDTNLLDRIRERYRNAKDSPALAAAVERDEAMQGRSRTLNYFHPRPSERGHVRFGVTSIALSLAPLALWSIFDELSYACWPVGLMVGLLGLYERGTGRTLAWVGILMNIFIPLIGSLLAPLFVGFMMSRSMP